MITRPLILLAALLLAACSNLDLNTDPRCKRYLSTRDMDEIRALLVSRPDIKKPLWGLVCDDRDHVTAKTGGARGEDAMSSVVTLVRRNGKWQIIGVRQEHFEAVTITG
jgi:hypothetical protein